MKNKIRQKILSLRQNHHVDHKREKEQKIHEKIINLPVFEKAHSILVYASFRGEVSLKKIKQNILLKRKNLILPRVSADNQKLHLIKIARLEDLQPGYARIPEAPAHFPEIDTSDIDLAIVPGVAFDHNCNRLGLGGGFYDKLLKKLRCPKVAVAFEFQIIEKMPREDHDEPVDMVITEKRILSRN